MRYLLLALALLVLCSPAYAQAQQKKEPAKLRLSIQPSELELFEDRLSSEKGVVEIVIWDEYGKKHRPPQRLKIELETVDDSPYLADIEEGQDYALAEFPQLIVPQWNSSSLYYDSLSIAFSSPNLAIDEASVTFGRDEEDESVILTVKEIKLDPSSYLIEACAYPIGRGTGGKNDKLCEDNTFYWEKVELYEGDDQALEIRARSWSDPFVDFFEERENGLGAVILGLLLTLLGILRERALKMFDRWLDGLGKYGSGRLAERRFLRRYLKNIVFNHRYLRVIGFNTAGINRPQLEEVYVSLRVSNFDTQSQALAALNGQNSQPTSVPFASIVRQQQRLVILGAPGAGKTTILSYLLLSFAQEKAEARFGISDKLLPIFVPLRRLSATNTTILEDILDAESQLISKDVLQEHPADYFTNRLKQGECIVLLDGLDEVTDEQTHRRVADKINNMVVNYPDNRYVVTCRVAGWRNLLSDFRILETQDFNRDEVQRFIRGWHHAIITQQERSKVELEIPAKERFEAEWPKQQEKVELAIDFISRKLTSAIDENNRILAIAVNPMLLSLICLVHYTRHILPRGRSILYAQCIELLIDAWDSARDITSTLETTTDKKESILREVAFDFQKHGKGEESRENLLQLMSELAPKVGISLSAQELLGNIERRSGLLVERSIDVLGFSHLTLQEYLVAKQIHLNPDKLPLLHAHFDEQEWREVILLYAGLVDDATPLLNRIIQVDSAERYLLAGHCVGNAKSYDRQVATQIVQRLQHELKIGPQNSDLLVAALASIASDYEEERAVTVGQKLSQNLLKTLESEYQQGHYSTSSQAAVTILGKARIKRALPVLANLLHGHDADIRSAAGDALVALGNLALPHLKQVSLSIDDARTAPLITVLAEINSASAAKTLMLFYGRNEETEQLVSQRLSRMLRNPFIFNELTELTTDELPPILQSQSLDGDSWPYADLDAKSPFHRLDNKLCQDVEALIVAEAQNNSATDPDPHPLQMLDVRLSLPAFVRYIRSQKDNLPSLALYRRLGFDAPAEEQAKYDYLAKRIRDSSIVGFGYGLSNTVKQNQQATESWSDTRWGKRFLWLLRILLAAYPWYLISWSGYAIYYAITLGVSRLAPSSQIVSYAVFISAVACIVFNLSLALLTRWKLNVRWFSRKMWAVIIGHQFYLLELLPYMARANIWIKLALLQFILYIYPLTPIILHELLANFINGIDVYFLVLILPHILYCLLSILYLRVYVLRANPIYQLLLLHKQGRRFVDHTD